MQMLEISGMELDSQIYRSAIRGHVNVVCLLSDWESQSCSIWSI